MGASCLLATVFLFSLADLLFTVGAAGRWLSGASLAVIAGVTAWFLCRILLRRFSVDGIAALVEKNFPELDNRLINYVQFSRGADEDPFKAAYVSIGQPDLGGLDLSRIKNRKAHNRGLILLAVMLLLLMVPAAFFGEAWGVAVRRMVNPFSGVQPMTLTRLLAVEPGDSVIQQGRPAELSVRLDGYPGHRVLVDVHPDDDARATYDLGQIDRTGPQEFSHVIPRLNTGLRYRFRAGDAFPSDWFTLSVRPPPALTGVRLAVIPPEYTGLARQSLDAREDDVLIPLGAAVRLSATGSPDLQFVRVSAPDIESMDLTRQDHGGWVGSFHAIAPGALVFEAEDSFGGSLRDEVSYRVKPDNPPVIEIISPTGRSVLPRGEMPRIAFQVADDYGLAYVQVQRVESHQPDDAPGTALHTWRTDDRREFRAAWRLREDEAVDEVMAFRIVARDNNPFARNVTRSHPIIFETQSQSQTAETRDRLEQSAMTGLGEVIEMQRTNIDQTRAYRNVPPEASAEHWQEVSGRQTGIRSLTRELLLSPIRPLGGQVETVRRLFLNEMPLAIEALETVSTAAPGAQPALVAEALRLQEAILRGLTAAQAGAERAASHRRMTGLTAMLQMLIDNQGRVLRQAEEFAETRAEVSRLLVDRQDALASDAAEFINACRNDADSVRSNDPRLADTLIEMVSEAERRAIRNDMLMAADRLEDNAPADAVPFAGRAHGNLKALQAMLEGVRVQQQQDEFTGMLETLAHTREKVERVHDLHERVLETIDSVRGHVSRNEELFDAFFEEYREMTINTKEAMLEVPNDLHVFTDLNVANELIEDVFSVFQEIEQLEGSEDWDASNVMNFAYAKEQQLVEQMGEILEEIDNMEKWLREHPSFEKVETEAFDREEMPESGIALGPLRSEVEDLIGDLMDETDSFREASRDSATTHAMPDFETGWDVVEGDIATFSMDGVSGAERPDHKEQDGRSLVGREGMSVGETAAGSGSLEEGDPDIQARRTEDPTQSGQVDAYGEGETAATGGGKLATGKADDYGMSDGVERLDSTEEGSWEGMAALLARRADAIYARASLQKVRVGSLREAAHHLRQADDAIAQGRIEEVEEFRNLAVSSLDRALIELEAGPTGSIDLTATPEIVDSFSGGGPDSAPRRYRDAVADYYRLLNESL